MNSGWIKLHRKSKGHWLYSSKKPRTYREAWEDILMLVNYEPKRSLIRGQLYECSRGQSLLSLDSWAKQFNWSVQQVRTFFRLLEKDQMITTEGLQYTTRLTVCNYELYQGNPTDEQQPEQHANNTQLTDEQQTDNKPITTTKEGKEIKEIKEKKERKKKKFVPPAQDEVIKYFLDNGYSEESAVKAHQYYEVANWYDSKGNQVKNWKQKMISQWFKPENTPKQTISEQINSLIA